MNLSKSDLVNLGFQALVGAFCTGSLCLGSLFIERKKGRTLAIATERLHLDLNLSAICGELQRQTRDKNVAIEEFGQVIHAMDQILCLQFKLQTKHAGRDYKFDPKDEELCFQQLTRVYANLRALKNQAFTQGLSDREVIDIEMLSKKIVDPDIKIYLHSYIESTYSFLRFSKWKTLHTMDIKQPPL
jgi:hypothetical protein